MAFRRTDPEGRLRGADKIQIQAPGSKTMKVDHGSGLHKARHKRSHRERATARTRRAR